VAVGTLLDFQERGLLERDAGALMATPVHEHMHGTLRELAPRVAVWLGRIG
jgi:hypothetical protein